MYVRTCHARRQLINVKQMYIKTLQQKVKIMPMNTDMPVITESLLVEMPTLESMYTQPILY